MINSRTWVLQFLQSRSFKLIKLTLIVLFGVAIVTNFGAVAHASSALVEEASEVAEEFLSAVPVEDLVVAAPAAVSQKALYAKKASKFFRKAGRILKNLLDGANMKGSSRTWKAGDTRTELGMILNVFSTLVMWGIVGGAATLVSLMILMHVYIISSLSPLGYLTLSVTIYFIFHLTLSSVIVACLSL